MRPSHLKTFFIAFLFTINAHAGDEVGGGGIAENNALYAWQNLDSFLEMCLSTDCKLDEKELVLLGKIRDSLPQEKKTKEPVRFRSEKEYPGFFMVDGALRIARTGYKVGDPIYFNLDLIYPGAQVASIPLLPPPDRPLDIPLAIAILVHELGHHPGERDHPMLDVLGSKVNSAMRVYVHEVDGGPYRRGLIATSFEPHNKSSGDFIVRDGTEIHSFRSEILSTLTCPRSTPAYFTMWNLHWLKEQKVTKRSHILPLQARVLIGCGAEDVPPIQREIQALLWMQNDKEVWKLDPKKTQFKEIDCGKFPQLCH